MPFSRPTLPDLVDRIEQDFISRLSLQGAVLRRAVVRVLSRVLAGAVHMLYGFLEYLSRQIFADTAESDYLQRWGSIFGLTRNAAAFATGSVTITGTTGNVITAGSKLIRSDGAEYKTSADVTIASGTATATVTALVAGATGNCDAGTVLTFESPVSGVDSTATSSAGLSGGTVEESDNDYRVRVLDHLRNPPQGGASADYVAWAKEVAGVTRVWVTPSGNGAGTVVVRFVRDGDASLIPDSTEVAAVQTHLDGLRPVTADVSVLAPVADVLNYTIHILPDTPAVRSAVQAELADLHTREAAPGVTLPISQIRTAIGNAAGLTDYTLTSPSADVTHQAGHIATLGVVTYV